jgi:glycosyltransferase involved in cell wall biosynthesis
VIRVLIVQREFAHYRTELLRALLQISDIEWIFAHDDARPTSNHPDRIAGIQDDDLSFRHVPFTRVRKYGWQPGLMSLIGEVRPDVVILGGSWRHLTNWVTLALSKMPGQRPKILLWTHGWTRIDDRRTRYAKRLFYSSADGLLVYAARAKELAAAQGFDTSRIFVIGNSTHSESSFGVLASQHRAARTDRSGSSVIELICVARLTVDRELGEVLQAQEELARRGVATRLTLVGDGADRERLHQVAMARNVEVRFAGAVYSPEKLAAFYDGADICVVTGRAGLTVTQSLAHGVPVIAHDDLDRQMPEVEAIHPGLSGDWYVRGDAGSLADSIQRVHANLNAGRITEVTCQDSLRERFTAEAQAANIAGAVRALLAGQGQ